MMTQISEADMTRTGNIRKIALALALGGSTLGYTAPASADGVQPYIGQLMQVGFTFCPRGYTQASGQILAIQSNTALFSLLGTTYGGNGSTTFALPDLRGRAAVHTGTGPGLSSYSLGEVTGTETTTLTTLNMAAHNHRVGAQSANIAADQTSPNGNSLAVPVNPGYAAPPPDPAGNLMDPGSILVQTTGNSIPVPNQQPYLVMKWCIATQGIFPARN
jgi:microcystin-dependent protein